MTRFQAASAQAGSQVDCAFSSTMSERPIIGRRAAGARGCSFVSWQVSWLAGLRFRLAFPAPVTLSTKARRLQLRGQRRCCTGFLLAPNLAYRETVTTTFGGLSRAAAQERAAANFCNAVNSAESGQSARLHRTQFPFASFANLRTFARNPMQLHSLQRFRVWIL